MCPKIRYDGKSWKFLETKQGLHLVEFKHGMRLVWTRACMVVEFQRGTRRACTWIQLYNLKNILFQKKNLKHINTPVQPLQFTNPD